MKQTNCVEERRKLHKDVVYQIVSIQSLTDTVSQLVLQPAEDAVAYEAGQYVEVVHSDGHVSPLSIACAPNKKQFLEFHLYHPSNNPTAQELLKMAQISKRWIIRGPLGQCTVSRLSMTKPIIFLARGTGFAPIKAIIEACLSLPSYPSLHLYWSVPRQSDLYLLDEIERWKTHPQLTFMPVFTKEFENKEHTTMTSSHLLEEVVKRHHTQLEESQVYACGSAKLIQALFDAMQKLGLPRNQFYSDWNLISST